MTLPLDNFDGATVAVIGDVMMDHYIRGDTSRISPEAPIPILAVQHQKYLPGGAGNVASNLASLGCKVWLMGIYGDDQPGSMLHKTITERGIAFVSPPQVGVPTIVKQRLLARGQQMLRVDFERSLPDITDSCIDSLRRLADKVQVLVLSDYGKGVLCQVDKLIACARDLGMVVLVDPKGEDFTRYRGASLITPNWSEFVQARVVDTMSFDWANNQLNPRHPFDHRKTDRNTRTKARDKALHLIDSLDLQALVVTRSERGMSLYQKNVEENHIDAFAREVFDVTGAGDTVISTLAATIAIGKNLAQAMILANHAASIVVGKIGVASVSPQQLHKVVAKYNQRTMASVSPSDERNKTQLLDEKILHSSQQLKKKIEQHRAMGERIVLTNGCFDLLHPGHVRYLHQSRALGDRLVVLVNADESVARLKGQGRPICQLADRLKMLAGLASVDWLLAFDEDTPQQLVAMLLPDYLVKGGDYHHASEVAGATEVEQAGGKIAFIDFVDSYSTTKLIHTIGDSKQRDKL